MDILSVSASIVGLVAAATKITTTLYTFTSAFQDAPRIARSVIGETEAMTAIFSQLNGALRMKPDRMSMTTVEQFVGVLTRCVLTFAELEEEIDGLELGKGVVDRARWTMKQQVLTEIMAELQQQKLSLTLMIGIWNCKSNMEAMQKYEQLCVAMASVTGSESRRSSRRASTEQDIRRISKSKLSLSVKSLLSNRRRSSVNSAVSLDQVQDINALSLPVRSSEIYNSSQYMFVSAPLSGSSTRPGSATYPPGHTGVAEAYSEQTRQWSFLVWLASLLKARGTETPRRELEISDPWDFKHNTHIGIGDSGEMKIVGEEVGIPEPYTR